MSQVRIAVAGAGMIGRRHIEEVDASESAELASIVDPGPAGPELAEKYGVPLYACLADLFADDKPDGIILATPNQMHVDGGLECVAAGVPVIVEKPIGDNVASAARLVEAGEMAGVPVLTGHHRNYSPIMAKAREIIQSGVLGTLVGVSGTALFYKPDELRRRRRVASGAGGRSDPAQPHPRGQQPAFVGRRHRHRDGGDVELHQGVPRRGHFGDDLPVRQRCARHLPALRRRGVCTQFGTDLPGEHRLSHQ